jgi:hypothetical protein
MVSLIEKRKRAFGWDGHLAPLLIEYEAVMTRAEHLKAAGLSAADVEMLLGAVGAAAEPVRLAYLWRPTLPDADDNMG